MARCCAATLTASSSAITRTFRTTPCCTSLTIFACVIGNWVTVGHGAIVHACKVGDEVLVGMGAVILDGAVIGKQSIIGAKALVTQGMKIPPGSLVLGAPAKVVRKLAKKERAGLKWWAQKYVDNGAHCLKHKINVGGPMPG